jgi:hypothetical protein
VYNAETDKQIEALSEVLEIKLIEKLREEEAGVYGVQVGGSASKSLRRVIASELVLLVLLKMLKNWLLVL